MKLVMTIHVRDEEEILDANLRYHLDQGVDFVVAMDNNSADGTPGILDRYARDGVLHVVRETSDDWDQVAWITRLARMAATDFGADWVINNDADEFWCPPMGHSLKDVFSVIPEEFRALAAPRVNFALRPGGDGPFYDRMVVAELESLKWRKRRRKMVRPSAKVAHRGAAEITLGPGSHRILSEGFPVVPGWQPITIFHYPFRSYEQLEKKVRIPETAIETNLRAGHTERATLYRLWREGRLREFYDAKLLDDEAIEAGLRDGRLAFDRRIQRAFEAGPRAGADAETNSRADGLELDMWRAVREARRTEEQRAKLARKRADAARARLERRLAEADRGTHDVVQRTAQIETTRWWRLGQRLSQVVRSRGGR